MNVTILRAYHALLCKKCGLIQMSVARKKGKCLRCNHSWPLLDKQQGGVSGVLASFDTSADASAYVKQAKERRDG